MLTRALVALALVGLTAPAAAALSTAAADLAKISAANGVSFPEGRLERYVEGTDDVAAPRLHDTPMQGDVFRSLDRDTAQIRIHAFTGHLRKMQQ